MNYFLEAGDDKRLLGDIYQDSLGRYWRVEEVRDKIVYYDDERGRLYSPRQTTSRNISRISAWYHKIKARR